MDESVEFSARASLVALGVHLQHLGIWSIIAAQVDIKQKVRRHTPLDKLLDCLITILAGGIGVVEVNTRVRPDRALQRAFGRRCCAEQSTISRTLNACTAENVTQLRTALTLIIRAHSQSYRHAYQQTLQLLDVDITGMPAGRQGEGVSKGYFAKQKNRRILQLGRVLATCYDEIIVDRLYDGKRQLDHSLQELLLSAEAVLELTEHQRNRTIVRIDGGGGDDKHINWLLGRGYQVLVKVKNWRRAQKLAAAVSRWYPDSKVADRAVGWVEAPYRYVKPTRQLALRQRKRNGRWSYHALVFTLSDELLFQLAGYSMPATAPPRAVLLAALHAYDRRGGGIETHNKMIEVTRKAGRTRGIGGRWENLTLQVRSPYGGMFAMPIAIEPNVPGAELLAGATADTMLAIEGALQLKHSVDPRFATDRTDFRGRTDRGRPSRELQLLVSCVREPNEHERRASSAVWLEGEVAEPTQISRHPELPSIQLAGTILRVSFGRPADFPGIAATIQETVDVNIAIPTSHHDAEKLYRQGNVVRVVGQLDCRMEYQGGEAVRLKLAEIDAEWAERKAELAGKPGELRRAETAYLRVRQRFEAAPRLYVLTGCAELLAGEVTGIEATYQARRDFVRSRRQQQDARRTRTLAERAGRAAVTGELHAPDSSTDMPVRAVVPDVGMDSTAGATRPGRPRRRADETAIADATLIAGTDGENEIDMA